MGFHSFSLDPRTVLGVGPDASMEEIREAYRAKSKKHHPDVGGDEWAFRMVARAYEVLKTTAAAGPGSVRTWEAGGGDMISPDRSGGWASDWGSRVDRAGAGAKTNPHASARAGDAAGTSVRADEPGMTRGGSEEARLDPARIRTVDVELTWTRFEKDGPARLLSQRDADDATLSVCMVLSWPEAGLVDRTAEFPGGAEILRTHIELFEQLRTQEAVVASRSRIEDGRFVGWLSYPDVLTAQDAFLALRDTFHDRGLAIKLHTRDERIPFDWHAQIDAPLMSQAS